jgi:hypothetical protein
VGVALHCWVAVAGRGDRRGIALLRAENRALTHVHTLVLSETGGNWINADQGHPPRAEWLFTTARAPAGYVPARVEGRIGARDGHVLWTYINLLPECAKGHQCFQEPVIVTSGPSGTFFAFGTFANHTCFGSARGPYYAPGRSLASVGKVVRAPRASGRYKALSYTFRWGTRTASEVDTLSPRTDLPRRAITRFPAGRSYPTFAIRASYRYAPAMPQPSVNQCG